MDDGADAERELRVNLMQTQIELYKAQLRWEPWKALAAMIAASAVFAGSVLALSNWARPSMPQTINVHLDAPLIVQGTPTR
jgi:cytochrome c-type biogenesis protein CcmH/NrfG